MPLTTVFPLNEETLNVFNAAAGTPTGSKVKVNVPYRAAVVECGFCPNSIITSATTLTVNWGNNSNSTASNFTTVVTSTVGTFASQVLYEGAVASVQNIFFNVAQGDSIEFVTSGGQTSAVGATVYAIIRRV